ncbi:hypothetical protein QWJ34_23135 [Saccharibacillus sp. CPCC 101409]|uniref:hypothetical protein n=1 Tax=Saccharibacillus sp. CPCC 101409 TaxID=3058041 RepID=UPI0026728D10|nr:hypothetical protein [Saccharibacillus sp. CPCC 101409]MDO3412680.1 hypothetical protein [Saccharibacillus sp. CPCC 101409]
MAAPEKGALRSLSRFDFFDYILTEVKSNLKGDHFVSPGSLSPPLAAARKKHFANQNSLSGEDPSRRIQPALELRAPAFRCRNRRGGNSLLVQIYWDWD